MGLNSWAAFVGNDQNAAMAVISDSSFKDGELSVKFKGVSGSVDQGAGIVWRYQDANNYYIIRANALEDNVVLYKVVDGKRTGIKPVKAVGSSYGVKTKVPTNVWHQLTVKVNNNFFTVIYNGQKLFDVDDSTFTQPGKVGLWTKADSVMHFDDFTIEAK
jgi:hypothetical protein